MALAYGLLTNYDLTIKIGTANSNGTWTYATLAAGIDNIAEAQNETVNQYHFFDDQGFAKNHVTGIAPAYTFTGKRVYGDAAQDYIFGKKYDLDGERTSSIQLSWKTDASTTVTMTCDCTICNIQEFGGASTDDTSISFEVRLDGVPEVE